jgi:hypothetical protein
MTVDELLVTFECRACQTKSLRNPVLSLFFPTDAGVRIP